MNALEEVLDLYSLAKFRFSLSMQREKTLHRNSSLQFQIN